MGLSNYQLILLDNLIYLDTIIEFGNGEETVTLEKVIDILLYENGDRNEKIGTGTIEQDCMNVHSGGANCMMTKEDWEKVLLAIAADPILCDMKIYNVEDTGKVGFRAATFISEETGENAVIFRGTSTANEWVDNGEGGYSLMSANQALALDYVNNLDLVNNNSFVVSGHSKDGNLAQFVALFSQDTLIDRRLSFDGQGFSKELCETEKYQDAIEKHGLSIYMIA